jgi:cytochrome c5
MDRPFTAVAYAAAIAVGVVVFAIMPPSWQGGASAAAAAAQSTPPPSTVSVGGVTLRSVNVDFPNRDRQFEGPGADVVNNNCLTCHSAGMVLAQPRLPRAVWLAEVEKMRNTYKGPIDAEDVPAIVDYLANLPH